MNRFIYKNIKNPFLLYTILIVLAFLPPISAVAILVSVYLTAKYLPLGRGQSLFYRMILSFILIACLWQTIAMIFWVAQTPLTVPVIIVAQVLIIIFLSRNQGKFKTNLKNTSLVDRADLIALAGVAVSLLCLSAVILKAGPSFSTLLRFNTTSSDDINHLGLVLSDYNNKGYVYEAPHKVGGNAISEVMSTYPQGWHITNSLLWHSISSSISSVSSFRGAEFVLVLFTATRLFWYGLLLYVISRFILNLKNLMWPGGAFAITLFASLMIIGFLQLVWLLEILSSNFSSFMLQIICLITLTDLALEFLREPRHKNNLSIFLVTSSLLVSSLSLVWILAFPVGLAAILLTLMLGYDENYRKTLQRLYSKESYAATIIALIVLLAGFLQIFIQAIWGSSVGSLTLPGGISPINGFLFIVFGALSASALYIKRSAISLSRSFIAILAPMIILTGLIYIFQIFYTQQAGYYYIKISWLVFILLFVFGSPLLLRGVDLLSAVLKKIPALIALGMVLSFSVFIFAGGLHTLMFVKSSTWHISPATADAMTSSLEQHYITKKHSFILADDDPSITPAYTQILNILESNKILSCGSQVISSQDTKNNLKWIVFCTKNGAHYQVLANGDDFINAQSAFSSIQNVEVKKL